MDSINMLLCVFKARIGISSAGCYCLQLLSWTLGGAYNLQSINAIPKSAVALSIGTRTKRTALAGHQRLIINQSRVQHRFNDSTSVENILFMIYTFSDIALAVAKARSGCERLLTWFSQW